MRPERINRLAQIVGARRYLEVGVCEGTTFFQVDIDHKVAVDPAFQFDHLAKTSPRTVFHQVPSDAYFAQSIDDPFDIIYLDGLHTFEQTLRDFMNSLRLAKKQTIWLIDDTIPNDSFAALPDERRCFKLRHSTGNMDWSWMGDVFKVVFFVGTAMRGFDYRTFRGHGQTVIWQSTSRFLERESVPLAQIGAMTYEDMLEQADKMNPASDEDIYAAIAGFAEATRPTRGWRF